MKNFIKISLLALLLLIISLLLLNIVGKTITLKFNINSENDYKLNLMNEDGEVEILDQKKIGNSYYVKVKSIKPGKVFLSLDSDDFAEMKLLYIHNNLVITDNNFFGKSTGSEIFPISITILLVYILYLLIKKYNYHKKENLYQYKNIAYLGIIIFLIIFIINNFLSIFNYNGLFATINNLINSMAYFSFILFPITIVTFSLVIISNILLIIKEGKSLRNILGIILGIFIIVSTLLPDYIYNLLLESQKINIFDLNSIGPYLYNYIETLVYLSISYLECILLGTIIIGIKSIKKKIDYNKDYIIILGCQIRKDGTLTPLLKGRVKKALEFRNKQLELTNKDLIFITSGGKGNDEVISEAEAMKNYLLSNGINENNIIVEDKSKNTYENIRNSYNLIKNKKSNICFSTTNYHVLRAGLIASEQGIKIDGIGSNTKSYFWINAFIREFIGTLYSEKKKHIIIILIIMIILVILIWFTFLANNI